MHFCLNRLCELKPAVRPFVFADGICQDPLCLHLYLLSVGLEYTLSICWGPSVLHFHTMTSLDAGGLPKYPLDILSITQTISSSGLPPPKAVALSAARCQNLG